MMSRRSPSKRRSSPSRRQVVIQVVGREEAVRLLVSTKISILDLLTLVCTALGVSETWFFGLFFLDKQGARNWMSTDKRLDEFQFPSESSNLLLRLEAQYLPEKHTDIIQDSSLHYVVSTVHRMVLDGTLLCPTNVTVELGVLHLLAKYPFGLPPDQNPPQNCLPTAMASPENMEHLKELYWDSLGLSPDESERGYLKKAEYLIMYGCTYFPVCSKQGTQKTLSVHPRGLSILAEGERLEIETSWSWSDIKTISYKDRKFSVSLQPVSARTNSCLNLIDAGVESQNATILLDDADHVTFMTSEKSVSREILQCCSGNHELYKKRRQLEPLELQQLRVHSEEERQKTHQVFRHWFNERQLRESVSDQFSKASVSVQQLQRDLDLTRAALQRTQQAAQLLDRNLSLAKEECQLLNMKNNDLQRKLQSNSQMYLPVQMENQNPFTSDYITRLNDVGGRRNSNLRRLAATRISNSFQELGNPQRVNPVIPHSSFHGPVPHSSNRWANERQISSTNDRPSTSTNQWQGNSANERPSTSANERNPPPPPPIPSRDQAFTPTRGRSKDQSPSRGIEILPDRYPLIVASRAQREKQFEMAAQRAFFDSHATQFHATINRVWAVNRTASLDRIPTSVADAIAEEIQPTDNNHKPKISSRRRGREHGRRSKSLLGVTSYQL